MKRTDMSKNWEMKLRIRRANASEVENGLCLPQEMIHDLVRLFDLETMSQTLLILAEVHRFNLTDTINEPQASSKPA